MTSDNHLESQAAQLLAKHMEALKAELLQAIVMPNLARLRAGNRTHWNDAGWFANLSDPQLKAFMGEVVVENAPFPVPVGADTWYPVETDNRTGAVFRFFRRSARLDLPTPARPSQLHFSVPHVVMLEALQALTIEVEGIPVAHTLAPSADYAHTVTINVNAELLARAGSTLHITLETPVVAVPALIYAGSTDRRLLSLAVTWPSWRED